MYLKSKMFCWILGHSKRKAGNRHSGLPGTGWLPREFCRLRKHWPKTICRANENCAGGLAFASTSWA